MQIFSGHPLGFWEPCGIGSRPVTWHCTLSPLCGHIFREPTEGLQCEDGDEVGLELLWVLTEAPSLSPIAENETLNNVIVDELNSKSPERKINCHNF